MKYLQTYNESLRDKMIGKTDEEVRNNIKKSIGVDSDIVSVEVISIDDQKRINRRGPEGHN